MDRYTAAELSLMATMMAWETLQREKDQEERCELPCPEFRRDLGRVQGQRDDDGIDCLDLANRLRQHAEEVKTREAGGPYRN